VRTEMGTGSTTVRRSIPKLFRDTTVLRFRRWS
jgi:hypothetical protein